MAYWNLTVLSSKLMGEGKKKKKKKNIPQTHSLGEEIN